MGTPWEVPVPRKVRWSEGIEGLEHFTEGRGMAIVWKWDGEKVLGGGSVDS